MPCKNLENGVGQEYIFYSFMNLISTRADIGTGCEGASNPSWQDSRQNTDGSLDGFQKKLSEG